MMKYLYKIIFLLLLSLSVFAGEKEAITEYQAHHAANDFQHEKYSKVIRRYKKLMRKDALSSDEKTSYAQVLLMSNEVDKAIQILLTIDSLGTIAEGLMFDAYLHQKSYSLADSLLKQSISLQEKYNATEVSLGQFPSNSHYQLTNLELNSKASDFAPVLIDGMMYYTSTGHSKQLIRGSYDLTGGSYQDIFESKDEKKSRASRKFNTPYHDGPLSFSKDGDYVVVSRNNYTITNLGTKKNYYNNLKLYKVSRDGKGNLGEFEALSFCADTFSCSHPFIADSFLYFASDIPGGFGSTDIYKVAIDKDGNVIGALENLGRDINTSGRDGFPFVDEKGELYFSSTGHIGFGGMDIFRAKRLNDGYEVNNLGHVFNSSWDDFSFFKANDSCGYFASNREGSKGEDDIYKYTIAKQAGYDYRINLRDKLTGDTVRLGTVNISTVHGDSLLTIDMAKSDGGVSLQQYLNEAHFVVNKSGSYLPFDGNVKVEDDSIFTIELESHNMGVYGFVFDDKTGKRYSNALVSVFYGDSLYAQQVTDEDGNYRIALDANKDYCLEVDRGDLLPEFRYVSTIDNEGWNNYNIYMTNRADILCIYYKFNGWKISERAELILDKLVEIISDKPNVNIMLSAHTDSRGDSWYNTRMSEYRAVSAKAYLVSKGIEAHRIVCKGYGESRLRNRCKEGVMCGAQEHQNNRRTEITFVE